MQRIKDEWLESINNNINEMTNILRELDEETIVSNPGLEEWSIMQIAAHVDEAIPFWLKHIEMITKDSTLKWSEGRGFFSGSRLYAISDINILNTSISEAIVDLEKIPLLINCLLNSLSDYQFTIVASSYFSIFDGKSVKFIFEEEVVKHIDGHLCQIKKIIKIK